MKRKTSRPKKQLRKRKAQRRQANAAGTLGERRKHDRRTLTMAALDEWEGRRQIDAHTQNLRLALETAVPFRIEEVRRWSWDVVKRRAEECVTLIGGYGEPLVAPGWRPSKKTKKTKPERTDIPPVHPPDTSVRAVFMALVDSCAIGALQPGGIRLFGLHFEAKP